VDRRRDVLGIPNGRRHGRPGHDGRHARLADGGGKNAKAEFGFTQTGTAGRWMDVTLYTSRNTSLAEALQAVPTPRRSRQR